MLNIICKPSPESTKWIVSMGIGGKIEQNNPLSNRKKFFIPGKKNITNQLRQDIIDVINEHCVFFKKNFGNKYVAIVKNIKENDQFDQAMISINSFLQNFSDHLKDFKSYKDVVSWATDRTDSESITVDMSSSSSSLIQVQENFPMDLIYNIPIVKQEKLQVGDTEFHCRDKISILAKLQKCENNNITAFGTANITTNLLNHSVMTNILSMDKEPVLFKDYMKKKMLFFVLFGSKNNSALEGILSSNGNCSSFNKNLENDLVGFSAIGYMDNIVEGLCEDDAVSKEKVLNLQKDINRAILEIPNLIVNQKSLQARLIFNVSIIQAVPVMEDGTIMNERKNGLIIVLHMEMLSTLFWKNFSILSISDILSFKENKSIFIYEPFEANIMIGHFVTKHLWLAVNFSISYLINIILSMILAMGIDNVLEILLYLITRFIMFGLHFSRYIVTVIYDVLTNTIKISAVTNFEVKNFYTNNPKQKSSN